MDGSEYISERGFISEVYLIDEGLEVFYEAIVLINFLDLIPQSSI